MCGAGVNDNASSCEICELSLDLVAEVGVVVWWNIKFACVTVVFLDVRLDGIDCDFEVGVVCCVYDLAEYLKCMFSLAVCQVDMHCVFVGAMGVWGDDINLDPDILCVMTRCCS